MNFSKNLLSLLSASLLVAAPVVASADDASLPPAKEITIGISDVFVPGGFDSEADSYVVVSGIFPNGCYQWKNGIVTHTSPTTHEIRSQGLVSQGMCLMVLIPFSKEIRLGQLQSGEHTLKFLNGDGTYLERKMKVE